MNSSTVLVSLKKDHHSVNGDDAKVFQVVSKGKEISIISEVQNNGMDWKDVVFSDEKKSIEADNRLSVVSSSLRYTNESELNKLRRAVTLNHVRKVEKLVKEDPFLDINGSSETSLISCLSTMHRTAEEFEKSKVKRILSVLLENGADINHQAFSSSHDCFWTPLWIAVHDGDIPFASELISRGARFDLPVSLSSGRLSSFTIVHLAASCGSLQNAMWLINQPDCPKVVFSEIADTFLEWKHYVDKNSYRHTVHALNRVKPTFLHALASLDFNPEDINLGRDLLDLALSELGQKWDDLDHNGETPLQVAQRLNSGTLPVFLAKKSEYESAYLNAKFSPALTKNNGSRL